MKLPFVSIIIPTLNEESYIENTLKAIKKQHYKGKYEIIVADGMSKDDTVKIAKIYADKIIKVREKGIAIGRNKGAEIAEGDVLLFVDADTLLLPNTLSELIKPLSGKNVVGSTCNISPLSGNLGDYFIFKALNFYTKSSIILNKAHVPGICLACKSSAFNKVGGFDAGMRIVEDIDLSIRLSKLGKIKYVNKTKVLTSARRIEKWGRAKAVSFYLKAYCEYLFTGNTYSVKKFGVIR